MQGKSDPQQRLRELERLREQTINQIPHSYGTVRAELQKVLADVNAEIAVLKTQLSDT